MPNHFHLVVETPRGDLVAGINWLLGTYTSRFNRRHRLFGHLFGGRYKSLFVDSSAPEALALAAGGALIGEYCIGRDSEAGRRLRKHLPMTRR